MRNIYSLINPSPENSVLNLNSGSIWDIIRIITGYVNIHDQFHDELIEHRTCLTNLNPITDETSAVNSLKEFIAYFDLSDVEEFKKDVRRSTGNNEKFYHEILIELIAFVVKRDLGDETGAFLHFYRMIERFSYCFPMIYAAKTNDFLKTYGELKNSLKDKDSGEIGFFKTFLKSDSFKTNRSLSFEVDFNGFGIFLENIKTIFEDKDLGFNTTLRDGKANLSLIEFYEFSVNARNRFFHNMSGRVNINTEQIVCSDYFYKSINDKVMEWFFIIFQVILRTILSRRAT